jgi:peptidyl-prolyl cis-trans isomerase C
VQLSKGNHPLKSPLIFVLAPIISGLAVSLCVASASAQDVKPQPAAPEPSQSESAPANLDAPVARVNGVPITRRELKNAERATEMMLARQGQRVPPELRKRFERDVLEQLIQRQLLLEEGKQLKLPDLEERVDIQYKTLKAQYVTSDAFEEALVANQITTNDLVESIREGIILREVIAQKVDSQVTVKPNEAKKFYDENQDLFRTPELVKVSHILVRVPPDASDEEKSKKRAEIEKALARVKAGEEFADVAQAVSEDIVTALRGGDLGYFARGSMDPEFEKASFETKVGELSPVITTRFGYHILKVMDRRPEEIATFEDSRQQIEALLRAQRRQEVGRAHLEDLQKAAKIEILLE